MDWTVFDWLLVTLMLGGVIGVAAWAFRSTAPRTWRAGMVLAVLTGVMLFWVVGAVGIVGSEDEPANLAYLAMLAVAGPAAAILRGRAMALAWLMIALAAGQVLVGAAALAFRIGIEGAAWPMDVIGATVVFAALWAAAALLFRRAAAGPRWPERGPPSLAGR